MESQRLAPTTTEYLRSDQVAELVEDQRALETKLQSRHIEDKGAVREQLQRLSRQLETQRPRPFGSKEIDAATKREAELRETISQGMLSHEEMRKNPPGAVDRHRQWEAAQSENITEWKNIRRRLDCETGNLEASVEEFRPKVSRMNMDGAQIPGRDYYLGPPGADPVVTFDDDEIALVRKHAPDVAMRLAMLDNRQRAELKKILAEFAKEEEASA